MAYGQAIGHDQVQGVPSAVGLLCDMRFKIQFR